MFTEFPDQGLNFGLFTEVCKAQLKMKQINILVQSIWPLWDILV